MIELVELEVNLVSGCTCTCHCHYTAPGVDVRQIPQGYDKNVGTASGLTECVEVCRSLGYGWVILHCI